MFTPWKPGIRGLAVCAATAGVTITSLSGHMGAASAAAPKVAVIGQVHAAVAATASHNKQLSLHITGSNFAPGSKVRIAVLNTFWLKVLAKQVVRAQPARMLVATPDESHMYLAPNPQAGSIDYSFRLGSAPAASNLLVLYRSSGNSGMQSVTLR
jgi:hypothetical protein